MITEALGNLVNTLGQVQDRKRKLQAQDTMLLLGSKFVNEIEKATDTQTLSAAMLKANKIAFSLGVPQLASQINNLGQIKQQELVQGKSDKLSLQQAQAYKNLYGKQPVLVNGEYKNLDTTDEFKQGENLDPALQVQYYQQVANKYVTELKDQLDFSKGIDKPMVTTTAYRKDGTERKVLKEIYRGEAGWMEHLLSNDTYELAPTPMEITEFQNKMVEYQFKQNAENEQWKYRQSRTERAYNQPKKEQVQFNDGRMGYAIWDPTIGKNGRFLDLQTGEDITNQIVGKGYKPTDDNTDIKNADVTNADRKRNQAANDLMQQLISEGKIDSDIITKHTVNNFTNAIAVLRDVQGKDNGLDKLTGSAAVLRDVYYGRKAHAQKVAEANAQRQSNTINQSTNPQQSTIETPAQKAKRIYGIK